MEGNGFECFLPFLSIKVFFPLFVDGPIYFFKEIFFSQALGSNRSPSQPQAFFFFVGDAQKERKGGKGNLVTKKGVKLK